MKKFIFSLLFLSSVFGIAKAQSPQSIMGSVLGKGNLKPDTADNFISFSPVYREGKTYVRWLVKNDRKDGVYIIERSQDGIDFEALGFRDRIGTQLSVNLFYSYVDEAPLPDYNHYRILQIGADNTYKYSHVVKVKSDIAAPQQGSASTEEFQAK